MGHIPVMSEFTSFRVDPRLETVENCRNNVEQNADLFVLIIGGKRGSLDTTAHKSIVNLEYEAACLSGLDIIVFVEAAVMALLPVWQNNNEGSFAPVVDSNEVFTFIASIRDEQRWTYTFTREVEIFDVLKIQISGQLRYLLESRRKGHLNELELYRNETSEAQRLVRKREPFWEYLVTAELLEARLAKAKKEFGLIQAGCVLGPHSTLNGLAYLAWVTDKFPEMTGTVHRLAYVFETEVMQAWGPPGISGKPREILEASDHVGRILQALVLLEDQIFRTHGPDATASVRAVMLGITQEVSEVVTEAVSSLREYIATAKSLKPDAQPMVVKIALNFRFTKADAFAEALKEIKAKIKRDEWD
jgi:hypothetical protein